MNIFATRIFKTLFALYFWFIVILHRIGKNPLFLNFFLTILHLILKHTALIPQTVNSMQLHRRQHPQNSIKILLSRIHNPIVVISWHSLLKKLIYSIFYLMVNRVDTFGINLGQFSEDGLIGFLVYEVVVKVADVVCLHCFFGWVFENIMRRFFMLNNLKNRIIY